MSLEQLNYGFNDALQTYYPAMSGVRRLLFRGLSWLVKKGLLARPRIFGGAVMTNERIVEYPVLLRWLPEKGKILDVGCVSSRLPLNLAALGYEVWGIDVRPFPVKHRNFHFVQQDLLDWKTEERFDTILAVSTIEHVGLGKWGQEREADADRAFVQRLAELGKPGARLLASMPFGRSGVTALHRVYDPDRLERLFRGFPILRQQYFRRVGNDWIPSTSEESASEPFDEMPVRAVVLVEVSLHSS